MSPIIKKEIERRLRDVEIALAGSRTNLMVPGWRLLTGGGSSYGSMTPVIHGEVELTFKVLCKLPRKHFDVLYLQFVTCPPVHERFKLMRMTSSAYYRFVESVSNFFWNELMKLREEERQSIARAIDSTLGNRDTIRPTVD